MRLLSTVATIAAIAAAAPAAAEPFTLLIFEAPGELALRDDGGAAGKAYWGAYAAFSAEAGAAGIIRGGAALWPSGANAIAVSGGDVAALPVAADGLALGGYFQIDVADLAAATEWARKLPAAATGRVEIRAGYPAPGM